MHVSSTQPDTLPLHQAVLASSITRFDGVVCFGGEDWWYHNRGHFDMQIMRRLRQTVPVLYVNSIGMRTPSPSEGRMFVRRMSRKLRSIARGYVPIDERFSVLSPPVIPGRRGAAISRYALSTAVRRAMRTMDIKAPLMWIACPTAAEFIEQIQPHAVVYQRTDRYEEFKGVDALRISEYDLYLKARADLTVFCSNHLRDEERGQCTKATWVDHGVDFEQFAAAAQEPQAAPTDITAIAGPKVGFIGGIDAHTFDPELFTAVARRLEHVQFVLIGACSLPAGWCDLENVTLLGKRPYEDVPRYMAACDVLIMPWNQSRWIQACNPVKLKEYLAAGRPVVSTRYPALNPYMDCVRAADDADTFAEAIVEALHAPGDASLRRMRVETETWDAKGAQVLDELSRCGIDPNAANQHLCDAPPHPSQLTDPNEETPVSSTLGGPDIFRSQESAEDRMLLEFAQQERLRRLEDRIPIAAHIVLAGGLRPSPLMDAARCSVLDLHLTPRETVLDCLIGQLRGLDPSENDRIPIRIVHDSALPGPWPGQRPETELICEHEPNAMRGPGGLLHDICRDYAADEYVVVVEAARYLSVGLAGLLLEHMDKRADVTVAMNGDQSPAGVYIIRCGALADMPDIGFTDLKEQWLPQLRELNYSVQVHEFSGAGALALRTRDQFLDAARLANDTRETPENRGMELRVVCPGSLIGPGARVVDSIVMPGAVVGSEAVVVRSLLCPDTHIQAGTDIADAIVSPGAPNVQGAPHVVN